METAAWIWNERGHQIKQLLQTIPSLAYDCIDIIAEYVPLYVQFDY